MTTSRVLYLFGTAAPPVHYVTTAVQEAQARGWDVCLGVSPTASHWIAPKITELEQLTGHPVRSEYKAPGAADVWPKADVIAVAPATLNSINCWALGITQNFVIGMVAEGIGKRIPMVAMPCVNQAYAAHPQFDRSVATLRDVGVRVLYGEGGFVPNPPGQGRPEKYPWHLTLPRKRWPARSGDSVGCTDGTRRYGGEQLPGI